jgi:hypothetical protein
MNKGSPMFDLSKFRSRHIVKKIATAAGALVAVATISLSGAQAAPITIPTGLNPGDTYRLAFLSGGFDFTNNNGGSAAYQSFVDIAAASQPELAALNTTWTPIISNPDQSFVSVDHARDLTGTTPSTVQGGSIGFPIFLLNDTKLADTYDDLWDGTIDNPFNVASDGSILFFRAVYTNSNADGTAAPYFMGGDPHAIGATNTTGPGWAIDGFGYLNMTPYSLYVISGLLTVPSESAAIPEPGSLSLLALGIVGLGYARRRRNA